jgi:N-acetylmuramic acid 6-phosphate etherase
MSTAAQKAKQFVEEEKAFRLGQLLTESSHPKTKLLSQTAQKDLPATVRLLQSVDDDIVSAAQRVFKTPVFAELVDSLHRAMERGNQIFFTGCGATGRLSILLEAAWRRFWKNFRSKDKKPPAGIESKVISIMAGGDFALIKSVEGFEDFPTFGRYQLTAAGVKKGDVVVAITEGGETSFVIGTAWQGLDTGAEVFFVYNNPTEQLRSQVKRSREVIEEDRIRKLELASGPMAVMGSTRMQATTFELLIVGAAFEKALIRYLKSSSLSDEFIEPAEDDYLQGFTDLLNELGGDDSVNKLAELVEFEEQIYNRKGLVTYLGGSFMLDILTDTTERSPTFTLPPFRKNDDRVSPRSWAFIKNPFLSTVDTWSDLLGRTPRGLDWNAGVYEKLNAPEELRAAAPLLDNSQIYKFAIGAESDPSRTDAPDSALITVAVGDEYDKLLAAADKVVSQGYKQNAAIIIGAQPAADFKGRIFSFNCALAPSPLQLWHRLAVKLVLNTLSTATMARMGRIFGNAMVWVWPSNKKLIDRGVRLISSLTEKEYEPSCILLFEAIDKVDSLQKQGKEAPSPVAMVVKELAQYPSG